MILVDTSVWVDHLRNSDPRVMSLLNDERLLTHPFVLGEIALGNLRQRGDIVAFLAELPGVATADDDEVIRLIERETLHGSGIGFVGAHLVASARLTPRTSLWTRDRRLHAVAERLSIATPMPH